MKTRIFTLLGLAVVLASTPVLVTGGTASSTASRTLSFVEAHMDNGLNSVYSVAVSPDDQHVYAAGYRGNAVTVFSRDGSNGELTLVQVLKDTDPGVDGLDVADGLAVSPDGGFIYVAGYGDDALTVLSHLLEVYLPLVLRKG